MRWVYSLYELPLVASGLICLALVGLVLGRRSRAGGTSFVLLPLTVAIWALANAVELACLDLPVKLFWANVEYLPIVSVPVLWLVFTLEYSNWGQRLPWRALALLAIIPTITLILVWTDSAHGLMRRNVALDSAGPFTVVRKTYGPWFYVHTAYSYLMLSAGAYRVIRTLLRSPHIYRGQAISLLVACAVPWAGNAAYILHRSPLPRMDPTPIAFAISCVAFTWGLLRWRLLDIVPAARDAVIEGMSDGLIVLDAQNRIVDLNPAACQVIGCTLNEAIGQPAAKVLFARYDLCMRFRDALEVQEEITLGQGENRRYYDLRISPLRDRRGRLAGRLVTLHDTTRRKRLEKQLRESQKLEAVGRLAGGISHHFNNLLTVISGRSEFLIQGLDPTDPLRKDAEGIREAARHAGELTHQLLAFGRRQRVRASTVNINELVSEMAALLRHLLGEDITLELKLAPDLGDVRADPAQIEQVIVNLLTNSRDAMPNGGTFTIETAEVDLDEEASVGYLQPRPGRHVLLAVSDTGIGMTSEVKEHLFEPFFTTKEIGKGTGLGLPAVYGIVEECGGCIDVRSDPGEGATFRIYLPRLATKAQVAPPADPPLLAHGSETILVVEDEDAVRALVVEALQRLGYSVLEARDGEEALLMCRERDGTIDLVLTDVVMPRLNGQEFVERLLRGQHGLQVAYMSGHTEDTIDGHGLLSDDVPLIRKPFTMEDIASMVRSALDSRRP